MPRRSTWKVSLTAGQATDIDDVWLPPPTPSTRAGRPARRRRPATAPPACDSAASPSEQRAGLLAADDRRPHEVAPLRPRAVVVAHLRIPEQVVQHEPGVAGPLPDPAVRDHVVLRREAELVTVDPAQLVGSLERAVLVRRRLPRLAQRTRDVPAAQRPLLRVLRHVRQLARVLLRAAHVDQRAARRD